MSTADIEAGGSQTKGNTRPSSKDIMGGVKNRARLFTEAIMIMVCPVLLAIVRGSAQSKLTSVVAGITLMVGIVQFLVICLPKTVNNLVCGVSKALIHVCVVCVMGLTAVLMNVIGLKNLPCYVTALVILGVFSIVMGCMSRGKDGQEEMSKADFEEFKRSLDVLANFSAAVTAVLFLGLEALALEGLAKGDLRSLLAFPLGWSFLTCAMLLVSVHPLIYDKTRMADYLQGLSVVLAICVCVVVYYFTGAAVGEIKALGWLSPSVVPPVLWCYCWLCYIAGTKNLVTPTEEQNEPPSTATEEGQHKPPLTPTEEGQHESPSTTTEEEHEQASTQTEEEHEPASLELTKITFAAFLAVSVTAIDTSIGDCGVFLCFTALAIITGVQWRAMTHGKRDVAMAADTACFMSHFCMACAVIPFALLAAAGVKKTLANGPAAAPLPSN